MNRKFFRRLLPSPHVVRANRFVQIAGYAAVMLLWRLQVALNRRRRTDRRRRVDKVF